MESANDLSSAVGPREAIPLSRRSGFKSPWRRRLGWLLAIALLAGCLTFLDIDKVLATLGRLSLGDIAAILALMTIDRFLMAYKWHQLLRILEVRLPFAEILRIYYQATFGSALLPTQFGGDLVKGWLVIRAGGGGHRTVASLIMEKLLGLLSGVYWAILGGTIVGITVHTPRAHFWIAAGIVVAVAAGAVFVLSLHPRVHARILRLLSRGRHVKLLRLLHDLYESYSCFSGHRLALAMNFALTLLEHALQLGIILFVARCAGVEVATVPLFAALAVYYLILKIPIAPGGWGVGEIAAIAVLGLVGVSPEKAFTVSALGHVLALFSALPGLYFFARMPVAERRPTAPLPEPGPD